VATGHPCGGRGWWIVAALAVTQTVGYGVLYYAFAVLLQPMAAGLHASRNLFDTWSRMRFGVFRARPSSNSLVLV